MNFSIMNHEIIQNEEENNNEKKLTQNPMNNMNQITFEWSYRKYTKVITPLWVSWFVVYQNHLNQSATALFLSL